MGCNARVHRTTPVMSLGTPPGGGVVLWIAAPHRPRFGSLPSLLCSSLIRNKRKISTLVLRSGDERSVD